MNEIDELPAQNDSSSNSAFIKTDGSSKNNFPPTPISSLFTNINRALTENSDKKAENHLKEVLVNNTEQASANSDNDGDEQPFSLSIRQPSFSNLTAGKLIAKGVDEDKCHLEKVIEEETNPVVVLTTQTETEQLPISLQVREASKPHFGIQESIGINDQAGENFNLEESISQKNEERLRKMGYYPTEEIPPNNTVNSFNSPIKSKTMSTFRNACLNDSKKIKRVTSAGNDFKNQSENIIPIDYNDNDEKYFDSAKNYCKETPSERDERIRTLGFEGNSVIQKQSTKKRKTSKNNGWKATSFTMSSSTTASSLDSDLIEHNFDSNDNQQLKPPPIDLKTVKTQQFINDSDNVSPIPKRLEFLIFNEFHAMIPEESVAYLALSGSDVIGYKEARINDAILSLRLLLKRCINLGFITESAYVKGVIDQTTNRQKEFKKFNTVNPSKIINENLATAKAKKEVKEKTWNARLTSANSEYKLALDALNRRYEDEKNDLRKKWHSKSSIVKYRKPSSSLNQMKYVAKKMLNTHRFEEAASLSKSIHESENHESFEAAKRMKSDYEKALALLERKYENERDALKTQFEMRQSMIVKKESVDLMPLDRTVKKFASQKEQLFESKRRNSKTKKSVTLSSTRMQPNLTINSSLKLDLKSAMAANKDELKRRRTISGLSRPSSFQKNRSSDLSQLYN